MMRSGCAAIAAMLLATTAASAADRDRPPAAVIGEVGITAYDGVSDDLLTAGLGRAGLQGATPTTSSPPTAAELRRLAIYANYRALVDVAPGGGYGTLYGPGVGGGPERIAGTEYLALARSGGQVITIAVQVPASFDARRPCIVTAPSSGSRGVYGAIGTAGEWGLRKGCAVAYTDKGTGIGAHDLSADQVYLVDGRLASADDAGERSSFTAPLTPAEQAAFVDAFPNRFAFEHAHSERNAEALWGRHVLTSLDLALWAIGREAGRRYGWRDTLVIGSSVSNGGGASIRAAEMAPEVFDGIAVSEPNVAPRFDRRFVIRQGQGEPLRRHSRPLYDYTSEVNLLQGCANLGATYDAEPLRSLLAGIQTFAADRCQSLADAGVLRAGTPEAQAEEARERINAYGILEDQNVVQPSHWLFSVPQGIAVTYANAYSRASVTDRLCGYSFAATAGTPPAPVPLADAAKAVLFGTGNGIPPTGGVTIVNDRSPGGPVRDDLSTSPRFGRQDQNAEGAICLRGLWTGRTELRRTARRLRDGVRDVTASARLGAIPTLIVHGRADAILPPNHTSRPSYAKSLLEAGRRGAVRYYEVLNAQHLDTFNGFPDFAARFVPLHHYFLQASDLLWAHLTEGKPLPPSRVVRATPRGAATTPITLANLPAIDAAAGAGDRIRFDGRVLTVPE